VVAPHPSVEIVVVVVINSVPAGAIVTCVDVVVALIAASFAQQVRPTVVPEERPAWLPVGRCAPSTPTIMEGEFLHNVQVKMQDVVVLALAAPWTFVEIAVRVSERQYDFLGNLTWIR
jgi:hypothetical protein